MMEETDAEMKKNAEEQSRTQPAARLAEFLIAFPDIPGKEV
jgi:hypothetical protein